ncbi:HAMP domain-containing sensor histidine kinase [Tumebacillus sp. DT12]|uniref:histidine kinase n=1 Tax=Tumebacillus lacus TaxID=2995335 RepID=A0ABT3WYI2_9BACL|nr:HAMP domain-containing sensor histidine kinase [Tumebacillus lacus]MCX7569715.1 HAMP domain-containing sensor histidine kinase [Tumebacillus lacus]
MKIRLPRFRRTRWLLSFFNPLRYWGYTQAAVSRVRASLRWQLILTFGICLLAAFLVGAIAQNVFGQMYRTAYIDYSAGIRNIDQETANIAHEITQRTLWGQAMSQIEIQSLLINTQQPEDGGTKKLIVDLNGKVLLKSPSAAETQVDVHSAIQNAMSLRGDYSSAYDSLQGATGSGYQAGREFVSVYPVELPDAKGYLVSRGYPYPSVRYSYNGGTFGLVAGVGTFFLLFFRMTRRKIGYIEDLAGGLLTISKGDLRHRVPELSGDELGSLARNINHMARELETKIEKERRAEKIKNELVTNVSHDLRTPLTSVIGYLRLLQDGRYQSEEQHDEYLRVAYGKSEQLKGLVEDLFEYTKLTNQGVRMHLREVCMNDFLEQLAEEYVPLAEENELRLIKDLPDERLYASVDPDQFVRVLENLLTNAVKYSTKPGEIRVALAAEADEICIAVVNNGDPIAAAELPRLFERFYRVEQSRSSASGGSGLGLAIVKSIVDLHGGRIWAESEGEQILFQIRLPKR